MEDHQAVWEQKKLKILDQLTLEERQQLLQHSLRSVKSRGETLYLHEDEVPRVYILDKGYIRFCRITDSGDRLITGFLGPADLFGNLFPAATTDQDDFIEVVREARIIAIDASIFKAILQNHSPFMMRMIEILETRRQNLEKRILSLRTKDIYAQTAEILLELSDKFGESCITEPDVSRDISLTHQEIADFVGIARPTVSKVIGNFLKAGVVRKHHQHLCLHDLEQIRHIAEEGQSFLKMH